MKNKKTTIKDIAQLANVSIGTVDRVLNNRKEVSEKTKKKILQIVKKSNYSPNPIASFLSSKKKYTIAVMIPKRKDNSFYWASPIKGIDIAEAEVKNYGINISKYYFDLWDESTFKSQSLKILKQNPDGVIFPPIFSKESLWLTSQLDDKNIPYLFIDSCLNDTNYLNYVGQDSFQSGYLSARLISMSVKKSSRLLSLSMIKNVDNNNNAYQRQLGFMSFFKNLKTNVIQLNLSNNSKNFKSIFIKMLKDKKIDGIFVSNSMVYKVAAILEENNIKNIPLIGYDLLDKNVKHLKKENIQFLIGQRPISQGYKAVKFFYDYFILKKKIKKNHFIPIDIISKENVDYFLNDKTY